MTIIYLVMGIFPLIAFFLMFWHTHLVSKKGKKTLNDIHFNKSYISLRTRGSVRQGMGKFKSEKEFYELEKHIKFPKKKT